MLRELDAQETKAIGLDILKALAEVCDSLCVKYYLLWGTLIGAVRHKGFIPWDDDIDIGVFRRDIPKLIKYFNEGEGTKTHFRIYSSVETDNYYYAVLRIVDTRTILKGEKRPTRKQIDCGVFVDIYPIEEAGNSFEEASRFLKKQSTLVTLRDFALRDHFTPARTSPLYTVIKAPVFRFAKLLGFQYWDKVLNKNSEKTANMNYKYVCCWAGCACNPQTDIYKEEDFGDGIMVNFEEEKFRIPNGYHNILTKMYGNYMKLPPEGERVGHHEYKAYMNLP